MIDSDRPLPVRQIRREVPDLFVNDRHARCTEDGLDLLVVNKAWVDRVVNDSSSPFGRVVFSIRPVGDGGIGVGVHLNAPYHKPGVGLESPPAALFPMRNGRSKLASQN